MVDGKLVLLKLTGAVALLLVDLDLDK